MAFVVNDRLDVSLILISTYNFGTFLHGRGESQTWPVSL